MAQSYTYTTLRSALQDWTEDDNAEFVARLDEIIGLGETKLLRDLGLETFDVVRTGQFEIGNSAVTKPEGYLSLRSLHCLDYDGDQIHLEQRHYDWILDYNRGDFDYGKPQYYAELNEDSWIVAPVPEANFTYQARVIKRPEGLSETVPSTYLSEQAGDALLYACLIGAERYLKADNRIEVWKDAYNNDVLPATRMELRNLLRSQYSPQTSVEGRR